MAKQGRLRRPHGIRPDRHQGRSADRACRLDRGQENQLYLARGTGIAKRLGPIARAVRTKILPLSFGFPFGFSVAGFLPPNLPLPTKIVTQMLEPIDIAAEFGDDPDVAEVDAHVREVMQRALDRLGRERRLPILG